MTFHPPPHGKKVLCQTNIHADPAGRLLRRILSITNTEPPVPLYARTALPASTRPQLPELTQPLPTAYNIYVDGGWTTTQADFHTAFQEQRDPTNRQGSAGIAIVNFELGSSELSCASTGEHAERSASRSRCLKSQDIVFTSVLFNCVFLLVRDWCEHRDV